MSIQETNFNFPNQTNFYRGKVREVYEIDNKYLVMIASDRISAFDCILPNPIPFKGQVLNQTAAYFLEATKDIVPNWVISHPHPNVTFGYKCQTFPIEMVIRAYLAGHAWREYKAGKREICGEKLPDGLKENDKLPQAIITPTTKAPSGHDLDISKKEILAQKIIQEDDYSILENYTFKLFEQGTKMADEKGLILVDTKYEFGKTPEGKIVVIDEIHTPDSSRYFYKDTYEKLQLENQPQRQLSKEFVRKWLIEHGFQGKEAQTIPNIPTEFVNQITERYIELYNQITGQKFQKANSNNLFEEINALIKNYE